MDQIECGICGSRIASYDAISFGSQETGYIDLCSRCFSIEAAQLGKTGFEHVGFEPLEISDAEGTRHRFSFQLIHLGDRTVLKAFEVQNAIPGGYEFQIVGHWQADPFELMAKLIERIKRGLSQLYLVQTNGRWMVADQKLRGRIDFDTQSPCPLPMLVIDGRKISWQEAGKMLMAFEGWQFQIEMKDPSEEF